MVHTPITTAHVWKDTDALVREAQELSTGNPSKTAIYHRAMEQFVSQQKKGVNPRDA